MKNRRLVRLVLVSISVALLGPSMCGQAQAHADVTAYLLGVAARPGYNFPNGDALGYGYGICDKVAQGDSFQRVMADVQADFNTHDGYQASFLISEAVNELCPAQIWQLRKAAANYRPHAGTVP